MGVDLPVLHPMDRSYPRLQINRQKLRTCLTLACGRIEIGLHRDYSLLDLSASSPFAMDCVWLLRFPCKTQIVSHTSVSGRWQGFSL